MQLVGLAFHGREVPDGSVGTSEKRQDMSDTLAGPNGKFYDFKATAPDRTVTFTLSKSRAIGGATLVPFMANPRVFLTNSVHRCICLQGCAERERQEHQTRISYYWATSPKRQGHRFPG